MTLMPDNAEFDVLRELELLADPSSLSLDALMDKLPKSAISARIGARYAFAVQVIAKQTGLSQSALIERLLCSAVETAMRNREVPGLAGFEEWDEPIPLRGHPLHPEGER